MAEGGGGSWNFRVLLGQGVFDNIGYELTSEKLVLPFVYTALGGPIFFAGLIMPIVKLTKLAAQIVVAPLIHSAKRNKWYSAVALLLIAAAIAVICVIARGAPTAWVIAIFVLVTVVLGASDGLNGLAFTDMLGRVLPKPRRTALLFAQSGLAGMAAVLVTIGAQVFVVADTPLDAHLQLMWIGVIMTLFAAAAMAIVREPVKEESAPEHPDVADARKSDPRSLQESFRVALALSWFRRFLIARSLFLSIELAMPFYAIHAAILHGDKKNGLSTFVIASSIGMVLGWLIWPRVVKNSIEGVLASSAVLACLAGLLALALARWPQWQSPHPYAVVIALIAFSSQGISNGRTVYLFGATDDFNRSYCIAVANVLTGALAIVAAVVLGTLAHIQDIRWPIWIMVLLNVAAALYVSRLDRAKQPDSHDHDHIIHSAAVVRSARKP